MEQPLLTVIVPHYEDLERLDLCLSALSDQTLDRDTFRIIVADNMSPSGLERVGEVVGDRAQLVSVAARGAGPARNEGTRHATTRYLAFTDSDCLPDKDWLASGLAALTTGTTPPDIIGGRMIVSVEDESRMTGAEAFERVFAFDNETYVLKKDFSVTANLFCSRETFHAVGPFRNGVSEDIDWCHRAVALGFRLGYAEQAIVQHPARRDWNELKRKWGRIQEEIAKLTMGRPFGRLIYWARSAALPASIVFHAGKVLTSKQVKGAGNRGRALATMARLRLWRMADAQRLTFRARS